MTGQQHAQHYQIVKFGIPVQRLAASKIGDTRPNQIDARDADAATESSLQILGAPPPSAALLAKRYHEQNNTMRLWS